MLKYKNTFIFVLILAAAFSRLIPHPLNFTPVGALGLFAGAYMLNKRVWLLPLSALLLSDFIIGFYEPVAMLFVYLGFALSVLIGRYALSEKRTAVRLGGAAAVSATLFFIVSNFGTWLAGALYPLTLSGLIECYVMAIPFYPNTLIGDLFYVVVLFGIFEGLQVWVQNRKVAQTI
ncbi:MAG: hypothetical protein HND53_02560 [Proteobacteria bacterium]|nr:hypothetical protein [Pseudomonadota bacterium]NOG59354.1 hypothetical protein [Pseudomonadota bacterium]